jgi:tartrate/fumarate subfamily iron-sulfur-dependent hydro-lyase alpha chain
VKGSFLCNQTDRCLYRVGAPGIDRPPCRGSHQASRSWGSQLGVERARRSWRTSSWRAKSLPVAGTRALHLEITTNQLVDLRPGDQIANRGRATARGYLRCAVDSLTGENSGNNTGEGFPTLHFHQWDRDTLHVDLLLKGGGSENVSGQYKLPDTRLKAGRDLDGVRKVVLDAVFQAQGEGCSPGVLGVAIGGDRGSSYVKAKQQLLRSLDDQNADPALAELEGQIRQDANELSIGPMGFGGRTTVLGVKIGTMHRLPASFFVSIAYMCWANRRAGLTVDPGGEVTYD